MLNFMRQNASSWVMIVLFSIIIFVFAINFGPWAGNNATGVPYAVVVNDQPISMAEFRSAYRSQLARIKQFRPEYDETQAERDGLKQMVLEHLVSRELLYQLGHKSYLSVGAVTLAETIKNRVFGEEAEFSKDEYVRRVNAFFQTSVAQFEQLVAKELVAEQVANLIGTAVYVSDAEVKSAYIDRSTKVSLDFVKVNPKLIVVNRPVSTDEIKRFESESGKKINDYYQEHISDYQQDAQIRASHILIKVAKDASEEDKTKLKEKALKIAERLKTEDFAKVAENESEDLGTKAKGGDLDFFSEGMMVEEFSKAAFALKIDEVSGIVTTPFGYHIIKKTGEKPKVERKLEDVSAEIAEKLIKKEEQDKKAKELAESALTQLKAKMPLQNISIPGIFNVALSGKQPKDPVIALADTTDSFNLSASFIYKIGRAETMMNEVHALSLENPTPGHVIEVNGEYVAVRLKSREEPDMAQFEEQKSSIQDSLIYPRQRAFMQQYVAQLKTKAKITYNQALMQPMDS